MMPHLWGSRSEGGGPSSGCRGNWMVCWPMIIALETNKESSDNGALGA